jgi:phospholipase/carboxylesterase
MRSSFVFAATLLFSLCCEEGITNSQTSPPGAASPESATNAAGDTMIPEQITYFEYATGGARLEDPLPMLVLLHGKLDSPAIIHSYFEDLHTPARLIIPRGVPFGRGYVWWDLHKKDNDALAFARAANEAARRMGAFVHRIVQEKPTVGKPVIAGFSQGGFLTYALVVRDPGLVNTAFPLSAALPPSLVPAAWPPGAPKPTIHAFHGDQDDLVPVEMDRASVASLRALGVPVTLSEFPILVHAIGPRESAALLPQVDDALRREAASGAPTPAH